MAGGRAGSRGQGGWLAAGLFLEAYDVLQDFEEHQLFAFGVIADLGTDLHRD